MSTDAQNLLASFDALPAAEKQKVAAGIFDRMAKRDGHQAAEPSSSSPVNGAPAEGQLTGKEWAAEFQVWARSHTLRNPNVDTSRESIYGDREDAQLP